MIAATIGVYGFDGESFISRLHQAGIGLLIDIRQRRGVRGAQYSWANSKRLQDALVRARIGYEHHIELAPTTELRQLQYAEDDRLGVGKRTRKTLDPVYERRYTTEILDQVDLTPVLAAMTGGQAAALLCVERDPEACHRLLVARRLSEQHKFLISHLRPL